jgi:hypothetical protein
MPTVKALLALAIYDAASSRAESIEISTVLLPQFYSPYFNCYRLGPSSLTPHDIIEIAGKSAIAL